MQSGWLLLWLKWALIYSILELDEDGAFQEEITGCIIALQSKSSKSDYLKRRIQYYYHYYLIKPKIRISIFFSCNQDDCIHNEFFSAKLLQLLFLPYFTMTLEICSETLHSVGSQSAGTASCLIISQCALLNSLFIFVSQKFAQSHPVSPHKTAS